MRRRTTFFIALALVMIFLYAVPVIRVTEGCPDYFIGCPIGVNITYYQSVSEHYIHSLGAEWNHGQYYIWPIGVLVR